MIKTRSGLEGLVVEDHDTDPDVVRFEYEAFKVSYALEGTMHPYTPDFLVQRRSRSRPVIEEVKRDDAIEKPGAREKYAAIAACVDRLGYDFELVLESRIRRQPRFSNVRLLRRHAAGQTPARLHARIAERAAAGGSATLGELLAGAGTGRFEDLLTLVCRGKILIDLDEPLDLSTPVLAVFW